jgi:hypothetical protein
MRKLFTLLALVLTLDVYAQQASSGFDNQVNIDAIGGGGNSKVGRTFDNRYEGVKGTPYLHTKWTKGTVKYKDGTFSNGSFKVDAYGSNLLALLSSGDSVILMPRIVEEVKLTAENGDTQIFRMFVLNASQPVGSYVAVVYDGQTKLLLNTKKNLLQADFKGGYSAGRTYDEFTNTESYFIQHANGQPVKINKLNKRNVLSALTLHNAQAKSYVEENKLDLQKESDVIKLLTYYDTLQ